MPLNVEVFGPQTFDSPSVLAIHGLTGHGRRWQPLADEHLPGIRVVAPDLIGHGYSRHTPPWTIEENIAELRGVVDAHFTPENPPLLVGHSFGGALSIHLAHSLLDDRIAVRGLILLDPAQGLDPQWALTVATDSLAHWGYTDADAARAAKRAEGWINVADRLLDKEIDDHLIPAPDGGVAWRVSAPAAATAWSEMSRDFLLPPSSVPTTVVVAGRVDPPFVRPDFLDAARAARTDVEFIYADCEHMVPFLEPELVARLITSSLNRS